MAECTCLFDYFKGYKVHLISKADEPAENLDEAIWVHLVPDGESPMICGNCGQPVEKVHEVYERWIADLPLFHFRTKLLVQRRRLACPRCGPSIERLEWLDRYSRVTKRLADAVGMACDILPVKHVAAMFDLNWKTVKAIDKRCLKSKNLGMNLDDVRVLAMDEFAIQKGHRYATVIIEPTTSRVLWVGRGRSRESIRPFFEQLTLEQRNRIEAVAMDMTAAYKLEVERYCPRAHVVYDLFHVIAKYGREVIDRVRVDEANRLRDDKQARKLVKGSRWLLLRNRDNIKRESDISRLDDLLAANQSLFTVYVLKDDLKQLWRSRSPLSALWQWKQWAKRALESGIAPLIKFVERLKDYVPGIIAHAKYQLHTSVLEGINNTIKVIKRMAYGYRDDEYFFLKIMNAFPGIGR